MTTLVPGTQASFRRVYEEPIVRGRQPGAIAEEKEIGGNRASEVGIPEQPKRCLSFMKAAI